MERREGGVLAYLRRFASLMRFMRRRQAEPVQPADEPAPKLVPRDTDEDWRIIGDEDPYHGVLTHDRFRRDQLTDEALVDFFMSGRGEVEHYLQRMRVLFGDFQPRSALDFGCGVGRLTRPLAEITADAIGVDVSPGMLEEARRYSGPGARFTDVFPERQFHWVMSFIVLQHITPEQGHAAIDRLLGAVAHDGGITLQVTFARTGGVGSVGGRLMAEGGSVRTLTEEPGIPVPPGVMFMHDYDLGRVIAQFYQAGFRSVHLEKTDHGGHWGAMIYARRGF